jgi:hypothetical protein
VPVNHGQAGAKVSEWSIVEDRVDTIETNSAKMPGFDVSSSEPAPGFFFQRLLAEATDERLAPNQLLGCAPDRQGKDK